MSYAADLINKARQHRQLSSDKAVAVAMEIDPSTLNQWKHGKGSPMPPERVIELCDLAGVPVDQRDYWLIGVQRDAVTITSVRRALDVALDRLRPAAAVVGLLVLVLAPVAKVEARWTAAPSSPAASAHFSPAAHIRAMPIMSTARAWLRKAWTRCTAPWVVPRGLPA